MFKSCRGHSDDLDPSGGSWIHDPLPGSGDLFRDRQHCETLVPGIFLDFDTGYGDFSNELRTQTRKAWNWGSGAHWL